MTVAVIYDAEGKILRVVDAPLGMIAVQVGESDAFLIGEGSDISDYIYQGEITPRPTQSTMIDKTALTADGVDVITISGAPDDAQFTARNLDTGETVSVPVSGSDTFSTVIPGTIIISIEKFPYLRWEATIHAD
jgi:hypothetical protein